MLVVVHRETTLWAVWDQFCHQDEWVVPFEPDCGGWSVGSEIAFVWNVATTTTTISSQAQRFVEVYNRPRGRWNQQEVGCSEPGRTQDLLRAAGEAWTLRLYYRRFLRRSAESRFKIVRIKSASHRIAYRIGAWGKRFLIKEGRNASIILLVTNACRWQTRLQRKSLRTSTTSSPVVSDVLVGSAVKGLSAMSVSQWQSGLLLPRFLYS